MTHIMYMVSTVKYKKMQKKIIFKVNRCCSKASICQPTAPQRALI